MSEIVTRAPPAVTGRIRYVPQGSLLFLLLKNATLSLATLGLYRFWARTALRRYYWSGILINGEPVEYAGQARELVLGFLVVLVIMVPLTAAIVVAEELAATSVAGFWTTKVTAFVIFYVLAHAALYRARHYRLTRTRWRGIRAGQDGSTWRYLGIVIGWSVIELLTLFLAAPWASVARHRYLVNTTCFGDHRFRLDVSAWQLIGSWMKAWAYLLLPAAAFFYLDWDGLSGIQPASTIETWRWPDLPHWWLALIALTAGVAAYTDFRVTAIRYFVERTSLGSIGFRSAFETGSVIGRLVGFTATVNLMLVSGIGIVFAFRLLLHDLVPAAEGFGTTLIFGMGLLVYWSVGWTTLLHLAFTRPLVRHICATLSIDGLAGAAAIRQSENIGPGAGEGLADGFEMGFA